MKKIYKVLYPLGFEEHEVADDFPVSLPFVKVAPLNELKDEQSQFFNFIENKWEEAVTQDYSKRLKLLETFSTTVQMENNQLKETVSDYGKQLTDAQVAVAEVYEFMASKEE